ncbi:MAG: hypothetical protein F4Y87_04980 [Synechococcus sp. SB0665_bin_28]|nr:hypothetical protein [Synechococcus sp. SB0667_bin_8]MXY62778.1 hypothetical protein [Synechococcus sp. SB0665_bin_28]MYF19175.1 hypothetical protein [Synechococcus sp. SB0677_bin_5]
MLDALPLPLPLLFGGLAVAALLVGVVVIWTRGRGSGKKAFAEFESGASPEQQAAASSEPPFEPLPPAPQDAPEPVVANFAPDQLSLRLTVPSGRRRPGASMKPFKEMAGSVVTKG